MNAYRNQYQQNQIMTASPEQILIMLYDGAIRFCRRAMQAGDNDNIVNKLENISKAFAIITEFSDSLNHEIGGEIASDLDGLYQFMLRELNNARRTNDPAHLKTVDKLLVDLRETWVEAIDINKKEQALLYEKKLTEDGHLESRERRITAAG